MRLKSKRNDVRLEEKEGKKVVVKAFRQQEDWCREYERYQELQKAGVRIPKVLLAEPGCLVLSYIEGQTALEQLEQQEEQGIFLPHIWQALASWVADCSERSGFLMKDMNPGNFIYHEETACFYGIDFEGETAEDTAQAAGMLLGFLEMADPANTLFKQKVCSYLRENLCVMLKLVPEILDQRTEETRVMIRHRRKKRMQLAENEVFSCCADRM